MTVAFCMFIFACLVTLKCKQENITGLFLKQRCPGLGEWWLHKRVLNVRNLTSMLKLCLGFLVDALFCVKWLARLSIFIHADISVLVSEFVVVVGADHC